MYDNEIENTGGSGIADNATGHYLRINADTWVWINYFLLEHVSGFPNLAWPLGWQYALSHLSVAAELRHYLDLGEVVVGKQRVQASVGNRDVLFPQWLVFQSSLFNSGLWGRARKEIYS